MDTLRICRQCRAPLPAETTGAVCPQCLATPPSGPTQTPHTREPVPPPNPSELAEFFPQLEIIEVIGHGGMGMVYKARQSRLDRLVALKILSPELGRDPAFAERFAREAKALGRLSHSNIVAVYDFGNAGGHYYFLMEFVDGMNLHQLIREQRLEPSETQRIVVEICNALQFAHDEGIVHRDIKPGNILLDKKGRVKIADFGLAKLMENESFAPPGMARTTVIMGTPQYMAPEQVEKPMEVDHRADLYSLGVVFYEMLTGELPLGRFAPPSEKAALDPRLDDIVLRALEKEPARRYQSADEIRADIETLCFPDATPPLPPVPPGSNWSRRFMQLGWVAATVALAILCYMLYSSHAAKKKPKNPANTVDLVETTPDGPVIGRHMISALQLTRDQIPEVNKSIRRSEREFTVVERRHAKRTTDTAGHVHLTIEPFPAAMGQITNQMWKDLGEILTTDQFARARALRLEKLFPHNGAGRISYEVWKENGEYHFVESLPPGDNGPPPATINNPPSFPPRLRSYLGGDAPQ